MAATKQGQPISDQKEKYMCDYFNKRDDAHYVGLADPASIVAREHPNSIQEEELTSYMRGPLIRGC